MRWALLGLLLFACAAEAQVRRRALVQSQAAGVAFSPSSLPALAFWGEGDMLTASDGDGIAQFDDQSGLLNHWKQSTAGSRPLFTNVVSILNNKPALWFDGGDSMTNKFQTGANNYTIALVGTLFDTAANRILIAEATDYAFYFATGDDATGVGYYSGGWRNSAFAPATATAHVIVWTVVSASSSTIHVDGVQKASGLAWTQPGTTRNVFLAGDGAGAFFKGNIAGFIISSNAFNTTQRQNLETFWGDKYGASITH